MARTLPGQAIVEAPAPVEIGPEEAAESGADPVPVVEVDCTGVGVAVEATTATSPAVGVDGGIVCDTR